MKTVLLTVKIISERVKNISEIMDAAPRVGAFANAPTMKGL